MLRLDDQPESQNVIDIPKPTVSSLSPIHNSDNNATLDGISGTQIKHSQMGVSAATQENMILEEFHEEESEKQRDLVGADRQQPNLSDIHLTANLKLSIPVSRNINLDSRDTVLSS